MASAPSKLYQDDVSLVVALLDTNPFFWAAASLPFSEFLQHVIPFINSLLLLNQLNRVVLIATGTSSCGYIYDSGEGNSNGNANAVCSGIIKSWRTLLEKIPKLLKGPMGMVHSLPSLPFSLGLYLLPYVIFREFFGPVLGIRSLESTAWTLKTKILIHRTDQSAFYIILCFQGSPDGPEQYVAVMNSIFSAQRSMVPIDSCIVGAQHSAFLQQASYITGGVYMKPQQLDGLFQYLAAVFATDLHSRNFLRLPKPVGVDFRASCFCHKKTIDLGYVCSVCLSIFCKYHKKCSTCGSEFNQATVDSTTTEQKR